jgi:hypothetical protein
LLDLKLPPFTAGSPDDVRFRAERIAPSGRERSGTVTSQHSVHAGHEGALGAALTRRQQRPMTATQIQLVLVGLVIVEFLFVAGYIVWAERQDRRPPELTQSPVTLLYGAACSGCGRWKEAVSDDDPSVETRVTFWLANHECHPTVVFRPEADLVSAGRH